MRPLARYFTNWHEWREDEWQRSYDTVSSFLKEQWREAIRTAGAATLSIFMTAWTFRGVNSTDCGSTPVGAERSTVGIAPLSVVLLLSLTVTRLMSVAVRQCVVPLHTLIQLCILTWWHGSHRLVYSVYSRHALRWKSLWLLNSLLNLPSIIN